MKFTHHITGLIASALADVEEPFSEEIEETAATAAGCLSNVLKSASGSNEVARNVSESKVSLLNSCFHLLMSHCNESQKTRSHI